MRARSAALLLLIFGCAGGTHAFADVRASLDASQVAAGDTVQLTLEYDGRTSGQPDITPLEKDFDILGTSSSTSIQLINGNVSEKTEVALTLAPKGTGQLTIPALSWGGERTQPLSLTVTGPGSSGPPDGSGASVAQIFIKSSSSPARPYVEAAVHLTVQLYTSETLYHPDLELPENSDFVVKQIGPDESTAVVRGGRTYQVFTRHYLLFPLHSGKLTLQGPVLDAEVAVGQQPAYGNSNGFGLFGGPAFGMLRTVRPVRLHGDSITLDVQPRPAGAIGSYWLPAQDVQLTASWNPAQLSAPAGDPVTLDLDLQATGLTAAQLPDLSSLLSVPAGLKAYPDQAKLNDAAQNGKLIASRDQTIALMADSPGHYTIPALTVTWWDTQANQPRRVTVPARTLNILPAPGVASGTATTTAAAPAPVARPPAAISRQAPAAVTAPRAAQPRAPSEWEWISIGLGAVWLATVGTWLWFRRSSAAPGTNGSHAPGANTPRALPHAAKERAAFRAACEANDAPAARAHLLAWATAVWGAAPAGVNAIAARIGDAGIGDLLRDLDRACYAGGEWQGRRLAAALTDLPGSATKTGRRDGLAPLYP